VPPSPMYEHDKPSKGLSVLNLSLKEEDNDLDTLDTSQDEDISHKLFGDLNRDLLGLPGDDHAIVISDSEEVEVHEDDRAGTDVLPFSLRVSLAPSASAANNDDASYGVQDDSSDGGAPDWVQNDNSDGEDGASTP
jgi:hypothetical protein